MSPEVEKAIRDKVAAFKATGKKLRRGTYDNCLLTALGGVKEAAVAFGDIESRALEVGFEGWSRESGWTDPTSSRAQRPDYYDLGKKIAEEEGYYK